MTLDNNMMVIMLIVVALIAVAAYLHYRRRQSHTLEKHFGPEYDRTVEQLGSRDKAERELMGRRERVEKLHIVSLSREDAIRFGDGWTALQTRFVDDPTGSLSEADRLVTELMQKRGYPMGDFDSRAADISVHHPTVVDHYRAAHDIAARHSRGGVDTEAMRQALIHYRALFGELLEVQEHQGRHEESSQART